MSEPATMACRSRRGPAEVAPDADPVSTVQAAVRVPPDDGRRLYGNLEGAGVSIEWHEFELHRTCAWSPTFTPKALELCLNVAGRGAIRCGNQSLAFAALAAGFYAPGDGALLASREPGTHRFLTVVFSAEFLRRHLASDDGALHPLVEQFLEDGAASGLGEPHRLSVEQEQLTAHLRHPPGFQAGRRLWYESKVLQLMSDFFFDRRGEDELFCHRQKRLDRERAARVAAVLRRDLIEPPGLHTIAREVGCSPCYLSRTFSRETGMTMRQFLCRLRIERAAELLTTGRYNVTEAAMEVGYSSLSHFSQMFCQIMGCCPFLYPPKGPEPRSAAMSTAAPGSVTAGALPVPPSAAAEPPAAKVNLCKQPCLGDGACRSFVGKPQPTLRDAG